VSLAGIARGPILCTSHPPRPPPPSKSRTQCVLPQARDDGTIALTHQQGAWECQSAIRSASEPSPDDAEPSHEANPPRSTSVPNAHIKGSASFDQSRRRSLQEVCYCAPLSRPLLLMATAFPHHGATPQEDVPARDRANSFGRKTDSKLSKISRSLSWNTRRLHRGQHGSFDEDNMVSDPSGPGPAIQLLCRCCT
jgi:hypothetical protein